MDFLPNSVGKQRLTILVDSQETALFLQPRIDEMNRRHFLPAIERALSEVDTSGKHVRIENLSVDLGRLTVSELDSSLEERLFLHLRDALHLSLRGPGEEPLPGVSVQSEQVTRLELLEHYLVEGRLPLWAQRQAGNFLEELLPALEELDPDALARTLRKCGAQSHVRERMVRQFREPLLQQLLRLLDPRNAELIAAYVLDLETSHETHPVLPFSNTEFNRQVWLVVLAYVTLERGSQFNRKSFLKSLLNGMAEAEGIAYEEILHILSMALELTAKRVPLHSSLPTVVRELARELIKQPRDEVFTLPDNVAKPPKEAKQDYSEHEMSSASFKTAEGRCLWAAGEAKMDPEVLRFFLQRGRLPVPAPAAGFTLQESLMQLAEEDPGNLVEMIRDCKAASVRELLVTQLDRPALQRLLRLLEPQHAALIIAYVTDLNEVHQAEPLIPLAREKFDVILWTLVLAYVLDNAGSQFNRKTFVKELLVRMSNAEGLAYREVLGILHLGVKRTMGRLMLQSSLPVIIQELAGEMEPLAVQPATVVLEELGVAKKDRPVKAKSAEAGAHTPDGFSGFGICDGDAPDISLYDMQANLRYYLKHGVLSWSLIVRRPGVTAAALMKLLSRMSDVEIVSWLRAWGPEDRPAMLQRAARELPEKHLPFLTQLILPEAVEHQELLDAVEQFAASAEDKRVFYERVIAAILQKRPRDLEEFVVAGAGELQPDHHSLPNDPAEWEPHALKSVILSRLQAADCRSGEYPPPPELLHLLVTRHPQEACHLLHTLQSRPALLSLLVGQCPSALLAPILELARPVHATMIESLIQVLSRAAPKDQPGGEDRVRRTILADVLRLPSGENVDQEFFARVLKGLFELPLAAGICRSLRQQVEELARYGGFSPQQLSAFASAIETAVSPDAPSRAIREDDAFHVQRMPATSSPLSDAREAVSWLLLGESTMPGDDGGMGKSGAGGHHSPEHYSLDALEHDLQTMMEEAPRQLRSLTDRHLRDLHKRERWTEMLSESSLAGMVRLLEPQKYRALLDTAEMLATACSEALSSFKPASTRKFMWRFLLDFLAHNREAGRSPARMIYAFFEHIAEQARGGTSAADTVAATGDGLLKSCERFARASGRSDLLSILAGDERRLRSFWSSPAGGRSDQPSVPPRAGRAARQPVRGRTAFSLGRDQGEGGAGDAIYITNAGLVLAGTFLPHLFESLNLLEDDNGRRRICSGEGASRAVHLLQYLVDGSCSTPEPLLALNKILCGLALETPVNREIDLLDRERDLCNQLLKAMIANWSVIASTSVAGLRETFLQREGKLERASDGWRLLVQRKTVDVLVDQISWSVSVIYHRWMPEPLYVKW